MTIIEELTKIINNTKFVNKVQFHRDIQNQIVSLADVFSMKGMKEFIVPHFREDGRNGFIDVVWTLPNSAPICLFEIDSYPRLKSIMKLSSIDAPMKFWIYYGDKDFKAILNDHDVSKSIVVIKKSEGGS